MSICHEDIEIGAGAVHRATLYRHKVILMDLMPIKRIDGLKMLKYLLNSGNVCSILKSELNKIEIKNCGYLNQRKIR